MNATFEQLQYTEEMLKQCWIDQLKEFETLVKAGWTDFHILYFLMWINERTYTSLLFPGSSLGTLLISKPNNGSLNYQQTLSIKFDKSTGTYTMTFSDWDTIQSKEEYKKAIIWEVKCSGVELVQRFIEFLEWKKNWC